MGISFRLFQDGDKKRISDFFTNFHKLHIELNSSRKVMWDCFSKHPCFKMFYPEKIGIWENQSQIIGVVRLESPCYGGVIIDVYPEYSSFYKDMILYAEKTYTAVDDSGNKYLQVYVRETDRLQESLSENGYIKGTEVKIFAFSLLESIPTTLVSEEFQIKFLDEVYSFEKLNDLLWRAFEYSGEPPAYEDDVYLPIKHAWLEYRRDICVVAEAPDRSYAAFCGIWLDEDTKSAFIEPLATAHKYRNNGLAKACIYEAMKRCKELGAEIVYVAPDEEALDWYRKIGFNEVYQIYSWRKDNLLIAF